MKRTYKKRTYGDELFRKLDASVVAQHCPAFRQMTDDMLVLAQAAIGT
jgi:hypothetical protein